jgi:hypothetical protein
MVQYSNMAKSQLRLRAREQRMNGLGIKTIAYTLGVSSSTVSLWCRDIVLTPQQIKELELRSRDPSYGRRLLYAKAQQERRNKKITALFEEGKKDIGEVTQRDLFVAGVALYWAEGFKKDNLVGFSNSDPTMILFFVRWLSICGIGKSRLKFRLGVNEAYKESVHKIEEFWQEILDVDKNQFQKPFFQRVKLQKIYDNQENYHGVLRVRVSKSTDFLRKIHGWIAGLKGSK